MNWGANERMARPPRCPTSLAVGGEEQWSRSGAPSIPALPTIAFATMSAMSSYGVSYHVARSTGVCAASGSRLEPGAECIAALAERPDDDALDRFDYSLAAWESGARPERLFSFWKTRVPEAGARQKLVINDDVLESIFERLAEDDRPQRVAFRFVLALILMRKRRLKYLDRRVEDGVESWLLAPRGSAIAGVRGGRAGDDQPAPIEVVNPRLKDEDVRELTEQLSEILQSDL